MSLALWEFFWDAWPPPAGTGPIAGSMLLLGVGRAWLLPWALRVGGLDPETARTLDVLALFLSGGLLGWGLAVCAMTFRRVRNRS